MITVLLWLPCCWLLWRAADTPAPSDPNIVFILADDLGWRDLACYGSPWHETPISTASRVKGCASPMRMPPRQSVRRRAPRSSRVKRRRGLVRVRHKDKPGRQSGDHALLSPAFTLNLPLEETTLAEMLKPAGYRAGFFGKWHLNQHHEYYLGWSPTHGPLAQGFAEGDAEFGSHPYEYLKRDGTGFGVFASGEFPPDALADKAIAFLHANRERPFYLHLSQYYVHDPIHTRARWLFEKYRRKLPPGAGDDRAAYGPWWKHWIAWSAGFCARSMNSASLKIPWWFSPLITAAIPITRQNGPLRGSKWNLYEGGIRVPFIVRWPGVVKAGSTSAEPVTECDLFPTFGEIAAAPADTIARDGRSLVPWLHGEKTPMEARPLVWHFPYYHPEKGFAKAPAAIGVNDFTTSQTRPHSAIRLGRHKLIHSYERRPGRTV